MAINRHLRRLAAALAAVWLTAAVLPSPVRGDGVGGQPAVYQSSPGN